MSYGRANGANGYGNGYRSQPSRYDEEYRGGNTREASNQGPRRAGGYGGFYEEEQERPSGRTNGSRGGGYGGSNGGSSNPYANARPDPYSDSYSDPYGGSTPPVPSPRRPREQREPQSRDVQSREPPPSNPYSTRDRLRPPGRSAEPRGGRVDARSYGDGPAAQRIEGVVDHINSKWPVLAKEDCVPAQVAMQLMDTSSLGRGSDYEDFKYTAKDLQDSLRAVVNEHHQGFNSSIGTFHKIQASIQTSQDKVRTLKSSLVDAKSNLTVARPELGDLANSSQKYDDMLQLVDRIEKIQTMPEQLDARISEKRFITAVDVLQDSLRLVRHSSLDNISALSDLKLYFSNQETSLTDILLEELHDHLYLKSPYCQSRWKAYNPNSLDTADGVQGVSNLGMGVNQLYRFLNKLDTTVPMVDDANRNPEEDSFEYIQILIEALNKVGALELAVDRMEHRLPMELFAVVEKTNQEVDVRHPAHLRATQSKDWSRPNQKSSKADTNEAVLNDLLHTLYSKFEAIAEGHRAVHEVISGIIAREGLTKTGNLTKGFKELWKLYQSEMRSLLHDYLATDGSSLFDSRNASAGVNIFRRNQRDKTKKVFKLGDLDKKSSQMTAEQEELDKMLQASVPGLVSKSARRPATTSTNDKNSVAYDSTSAGHKLLVEPSVFNISVLLPPSLVFLQRLKDTVPGDADIAVSTLTSFLDDFLVNVFNPQLEETLNELCSQSFMQMDAFQQDPNWSEHANMPIFKGTSMFYALVKEFCKMLDNIPQDQLFTNMILSQLGTYYERCTTWSETIVSRAREEGNAELKLAAAILKQGGEYVTNLKEIWSTEDDAQQKLMSTEVNFLINRANEKSIAEYDIVSDRRAATSLCLLYSSMQWLSTQLRQLRFVVKKNTGNDPKQARANNRWTMLSAATGRDGDQPVILPLTDETAVPFDKVLGSYRDLASWSLNILHVDIRLNMILSMSRTLESSYSLEQAVNEPDPNVLHLNNDLLAFDDTMTAHLPEREYDFITKGLALLLDTYILSHINRIKTMDEHGCDRMQLNILVLQQNLRSVEKDALLSRSAQFFNFFKLGPKAIVQKAADTGGEGLGFSLDELKALVELCYSSNLQSQQREISSQAKRAMGDHMLQLEEYMWSS